MKTLTITDANIFIDLFELDLLHLLFQLNLAIHTTKEVLLECDSKQRKKLELFIEEGLLTLHILSDSDWEMMETLEFNRGLSTSDKGILFLAVEQNAMVLTGDNLIRKWCLRNQLEVHGILWVIDQLREFNLLTIIDAIEKLEYLMKINLWLPTKACEELLKKWDSSNES